MGPRRKQAKGRRHGPTRKPFRAARPPRAVCLPGHFDAVQGAVQEAAADRVRDGVARAMTRAMVGQPTVRALCEVVDEAYDLFDAHMVTASFSPPMACKRGCIYCCYNQISLSGPEALFLGLYAFERFGPQRLARIDARVAAVLGRINGLTRREVGAIRHLVPCPLLEDGACLVHPARPLACRGWNAVDADQCRRSVAEADPLASIENHPFPRLLADAIQVGLLQGSQGQGLEAGFLVITRAWRLMRQRGLAHCAGEWLAGRPFFGLWAE